MRAGWSLTDEVPADTRIKAVLAVVGGDPLPLVARRHRVDVTVLHRWVLAFVEAGTGAIANEPPPNLAEQRDRFLAVVAHELRTPLTVAQGWSSLLREEQVPPEDVPASLEKLDSALAQIQDRVREFELLAAAALGRLQLSPDVVRVGDLAADLDVAVGGQGPEVLVYVDRDLAALLLRDVWRAAHTHPRPGVVRVETEHLDDWVEIRVVREGEPLDPEWLRGLFEPFELHADDADITVGLYLARALTVAHGGTLGVDQEATETTFWLRVPDLVKIPAQPGRGQERPRVFRLACGDVIPGCPARFDNPDRTSLLAEVARHAASAHGIVDIDAATLALVQSRIVETLDTEPST